MLALACSGGHELVVDLRTDYVPGIEFDSVEVTAGPPGGAGTTMTLADASGDFRAGVHLATFTGLADGESLVRVELRSPRGTVASRRVVVTLHGDLAILVTITRACATIACPGASDAPDATECYAGRCVPPTCVDEGTCGAPECEAPSDCPAGAACAVPSCEDGVCLRVGDSSLCSADQYCNPDRGCLDCAPPPDAGAPTDSGIAMDGGVSDAGRDSGPDGGPAAFIAMYVPAVGHDGNFGGRAGLDAFCASEMPNPSDFADCGTPHAFVSVNAADEIADMPTRYGYTTTIPIYWYDPRTRMFTSLVAEEWLSLLDGGIVVGQMDGTGVMESAWSGSMANGHLATTHCNNWSNMSTAVVGAVGNSETGAHWLETTAMQCARIVGVRCVCEIRR